MADTVKTYSILKIKLGFNDGDTRTISLDNPRGNLTAANIYELSQFIKTNNLLLGDKTGADSSGILTADIVETARVNIDITNT